MERKQGFDMLITLAEAGYREEMECFNATDSKANSVIGYIAVAAALLTISLRPTEPLTVLPALALTVALFGFVAAVTCAIVALWPRNIKLPVSAIESLAYWRSEGDADLAVVLIEGTEEAQKHLHKVVSAKVGWLSVAYVGVGIGMFAAAVFFSIGALTG